MKFTPTALAAFLGLSVSAFSAEVSGGSNKTGTLVAEPRLPVYPPKNSPDAVAKNFAKAKTPAGFTASVWAGEPLLANPVAFCFDGKGRMFISETHRFRSSVLDIRHYYWMVEDDLAYRNQDEWMAGIKKNFPNDWQQLERESELVRLVEDGDGDGKAEKSSVYADGFNSALDGIASGVLWHNDALYFTNIPALWKMTGASKAEKKEELHRGYGVRFSYTGHDFHGIIAGPDGRLYFSIGDRGASIKTKEGTSIELPDEGAVFRCEPDGSRLELVMRGLRNPQELAFDDFGNLFTGDNDSDQGDRERWVNVVEGADAGWRIGWQHHPLGKGFNPWLAEKMWEPRDAKKSQPAYILPPIANLPDGPSGLVRYPGTGLPAEFAGSFFLASYKGSTAKSQVATFKTEPVGASWKLTGLRTFIDNVQATDVDFGPDSRFYVSAWDEGWDRTDQGRIYVLGHDAARKEQAAQIAEVQKLLGEGFKKRTPAELVKLLAHADQRVRLGAQWELSAKYTATPGAVEPLLNEAITKGADGPAKRLSRLHAMWAISNAIRTAPTATTDAFRILLPNKRDLSLAGDADEEVRRQTIIGMVDKTNIEKWSPEATKLISAALADQSPRVRQAAAMALAKSGASEFAFAVLMMLRENDGKDFYLEHAGVMALAGLKNEQALAEAAKASNRSVRLAALLAYRRLGSEKIASFLADADSALVREAAIAINDVPISAAMPALAKKINLDLNDNALTSRVLNANFRTGGKEGADALSIFAMRSKSEGLRVVALNMLKNWAKPPQRDYVVGTFRPLKERAATETTQALESITFRLLTDPSEKVLIAASEAMAANGVKKSSTALTSVVQNTKAPVKARIAALDALAKLATPEFETALASASTDADQAMKTAASKFAGKLNPDTAVSQLSTAWTTATPAQKQDIADVLGDVKSAKAGEFLAKLVAGIAKEPGEAHLEILEAAAKHESAKASVAAYEKALSDPLAKFNITLKGGDKVAGEKLFKEHPVAACLRCHKVGGTGGDAGPDLTGFAKIHDRAYILESIVNVNAKIAPGFQMVILTMKDGSVKAGSLKSEKDGVLTLQNPGAPAEQVKAADIAKRENAPSGMLPTIGDLISRRELRDIIEYVANLK